MKLAITIEDVKRIYADMLHVDANSLEIEIKFEADPIIRTTLEAVAQCAIDTHNKISAIKLLRNQHPEYSLWEGKTVVEHISEAIDIANRTKKWPLPIKTFAVDASSYRWALCQ